MDIRKKFLDSLAKDIASGRTDLDAYVVDNKSPASKALQFRDMTEDALAKKVLDNTNVPIPGKGASRSQIEDFVSRVIKEQYPEFDPNVKLLDDLTVDTPDGREASLKGGYHKKSGDILLNKKYLKNPIDVVSTGLHEASHKYDNKVRNFKGTDILDLSSLDGASALENYEKMAVKHHDTIPELREGSFGLGALKSYLKSGKFKALAGMAGPAATAAGALLAGSPVDAMAEAIPGGVENVGEGSDQVLTPEQERSVESSRELTGGANLNQARLQALQKMLRR